MCANAQLPLPLDFTQCFDHLEVPFEYRRDAYPVQDAPVLLHLPDDSRLVPVRAMWGIYPQWAKAKSYARKTYNARSETVSKLPSYRGPWARRQTCPGVLRTVLRQRTRRTLGDPSAGWRAVLLGRYLGDAHGNGWPADPLVLIADDQRAIASRHAAVSWPG